jgi:hypothetical protein
MNDEEASDMRALTMAVPRWLVALTALPWAFCAAKARAEGAQAYAPIPTASVVDVAPPAQAARPGETTFGRLRYALLAEPAVGVAGGSFYNQLTGARVDYRFTEEIALGMYLGYANLKGKEGRAHSVLPYLNLEYRPRLGRNSAFGLPLGFGTGYLPNNGPWLRLSAGVSYALSSQTDVVLTFFNPTFWVVHDRTVISLGAALEVSYAP